MERNFISNLKEKKNVVKLSMAALVSAITVCGGVALCSASAMKRADDLALQGTGSQPESCSVENQMKKDVAGEKERKCIAPAAKIVNNDKYDQFYEYVKSGSIDVFKVLSEEKIDLYQVRAYVANVYGCDDKFDKLIKFIKKISDVAKEQRRDISEFKSIYALYLSACDGSAPREELWLGVTDDDITTLLKLLEEEENIVAIKLICVERIKFLCKNRGNCDENEGIINLDRLDMGVLKELVNMLKYDTTFVLLDLNSCEIGINEAKEISKVLEVNTVLQEINLGNNLIGVEGAKVISEALKKNTTLLKLDLSCNEMENAGAEAVSEMLSVNSAIKELNLSANNIGYDGLKMISEVLKVNTTLEAIILDGNELGDEGVKCISEALNGNTTVTKLGLARFFEEIGSAVGMTLEGARAVSVLIRVNTTITDLDLSGHMVNECGMNMISDELKKNTTLTKLSWRGDLGWEGYMIKGEMRFIFAALMYNTSLEYLDMGGNGFLYEDEDSEKAAATETILAQMLKENKTLTDLDLSSTFLSIDGKIKLHEALKVNTTLVSLGNISTASNDLEWDLEKIFTSTLGCSENSAQKLVRVIKEMIKDKDFSPHVEEDRVKLSDMFKSKSCFTGKNTEIISSLCSTFRCSEDSAKEFVKAMKNAIENGKIKDQDDFNDMIDFMVKFMMWYKVLQ